MILETIEDYYKNKLLIPKCEETIRLDEAIKKYSRLKRSRKSITAKNESDINGSLRVVRHRMGTLKDKLTRDGLWG
jgi:hypothetical protein